MGEYIAIHTSNKGFISSICKELLQNNKIDNMIENWQNTRTSTLHNIYIVYKYIEKYLTLLDIREMHIKALNEILLHVSHSG